MRSDGYRRSADPFDSAPYQYPAQRCDSCNRPLSRYNGYTTCGPCRYRIATNIVDDYYELAEEQPDSWRDTEPIYHRDRFKRRLPIPIEAVVAAGDLEPDDMSEEAA